jgi:hypothetical protein
MNGESEAANRSAMAKKQADQTAPVEYGYGGGSRAIRNATEKSACWELGIRARHGIATEEKSAGRRHAKEAMQKETAIAEGEGNFTRPQSGE